MDSRKFLEQHLQTLTALQRGGIKRGFGGDAEDEDDLANALAAQWETQVSLLRRVLSERGDPTDQLLEWRERTEGFIDKFPEREGWTDREGQAWNAQQVIDAIDKLLEAVEAALMEAEEFEEYEDEEFEEYD